MGQLNHSGNGVLDGWLWISGGYHVAVSHVSELSEEFSIQGVETPSFQALDTDETAPVEWPLGTELFIYVKIIWHRNMFTLLEIKKRSQVQFQEQADFNSFNVKEDITAPMKK